MAIEAEGQLTTPESLDYMGRALGMQLAQTFDRPDAHRADYSGHWTGVDMDDPALSGGKRFVENTIDGYDAALQSLANGDDTPDEGADFFARYGSLMAHLYLDDASALMRDRIAAHGGLEKVGTTLPGELEVVRRFDSAYYIAAGHALDQHAFGLLKRVGGVDGLDSARGIERAYGVALLLCPRAPLDFPDFMRPDTDEPESEVTFAAMIAEFDGLELTSKGTIDFTTSDDRRNLLSSIAVSVLERRQESSSS